MISVAERASRAEKLLADEVLNEAFEQVQQTLLDAFTNCPTDNSEMMVDISKRLHLLKCVRANLERAVEDGKLEEYRIEQEKKSGIIGDIWKRRA